MNFPNPLSELILEQELYHLKITLNRPEKKNALNPQMIKELKDVFGWVYKQEDIKIIIITGANSSFCSGADLAYLKEMRSYNYNKNLEDSQSIADLFLTIYKFPKPVIAQVNGAALAGGCGLAIICDFVIASESAIFGFPEVKIGFVPALVSTFLIRQIGGRLARDLLLSGRTITAEEAFNLGLINKYVSSENLHKEVNNLAEKLNGNSLNSMNVTKEILNTFSFKDIEDDIVGLAKINAEQRQTEDFYEGISSFLEKRKPKWAVSPTKGE